MKSAALVVLLCLFSASFSYAGDPVDAALSANAAIVLRARLLSKNGADKYAWYTVKVIKVFKNETKDTLGEQLDVAAYSFKPGVPDGNSTLYLERYSAAKPVRWKLVGGEASTGVSHVSQ